jgi:tetratricopeptide (TPR) repeat protein
MEARDVFRNALTIFESVGDVRGQIRCNNNIGIIAINLCHTDDAAEAFHRAIALARGAGMPDLGGIAALNLGVVFMRSGDFERAREQFADAIEVFAAAKHSQNQVAALYNLAHVERELAQWEAAAELYESTASLAQRIGQSDIEIGALAGAANCFLALGKTDVARRNYEDVRIRMADQADWFQNREHVEDLLVRFALLEGRPAEAIARMENALALAESADPYAAVWLNAECAAALSQHDAQWVQQRVRQYASTVASLGSPAMTRRYEALARE